MALAYPSIWAPNAVSTPPVPSSTGVGVQTPVFQAIAHPAVPTAPTAKMLMIFFAHSLLGLSSSIIEVNESVLARLVR